jgi:hypothetical protein
MSPPVVCTRSIFRGRLIFAMAAWLLEESATHVVTATVPGAETRQPVGDRTDVLRQVAAGTAQTSVRPWATNRVVWVTPFEGAYAIGLFWNDQDDRFIGHYVNLQAPLERSPYGFDARDHVLDIVIRPDGTWRWKDEDELRTAVEVGLFTPAEAAGIRAEGQRVLDNVPRLLPTGWEDWRPDAAWPVADLRLPAAVRDA